MAGGPLPAETRAKIIRLLKTGKLSYRQIGEQTGASSATVGRIAAETNLRTNPTSPRHMQIVSASAMNRARAEEARSASEMDRARACVVRAAESLRIVGCIRDVIDLWDAKVSSPPEDGVDTKTLADLSRTLGSLTRAHSELEATERQSRVGATSGEATSMIAQLVEGFSKITDESA